MESWMVSRIKKDTSNGRTDKCLTCFGYFCWGFMTSDDSQESQIQKKWDGSDNDQIDLLQRLYQRIFRWAGFYREIPPWFEYPSKRFCHGIKESDANDFANILGMIFFSFLVKTKSYSIRCKPSKDRFISFFLLRIQQQILMLKVQKIHPQAVNTHWMM